MQEPISGFALLNEMNIWQVLMFCPHSWHTRHLKLSVLDLGSMLIRQLVSTVGKQSPSPQVSVILPEGVGSGDGVWILSSVWCQMRICFDLMLSYWILFSLYFLQEGVFYCQKSFLHSGTCRWIYHVTSHCRRRTKNCTEPLLLTLTPASAWLQRGLCRFSLYCKKGT